MVHRKVLDPDASPAAAFGVRMRRLREGRGLRQDELAEVAAYSSQHISAVETARKPPTLRFSRKLDEVFGLAGADSFEQEWRHMQQGSLLEGFPEYLSYEARAAEIRLYEVGVIPGLLQTPEYAAALEADAVRRGAITPEQAKQRVELVQQRQASLNRSPAPQLFVVLDEGCVRRPMGPASLMDAQYARLAAFAQLPNTTLQIAPFSMGARRPFSLPITVLTMPDRSLMSYAESSQRGHLERDETFVLPMLAAYHQLQAEALSQALSVAMIEDL